MANDSDEASGIEYIDEIPSASDFFKNKNKMKKIHLKLTQKLIKDVEIISFNKEIGKVSSLYG